ncbi:hypothetical protein, partial [Vibrio kanaloae]|uniref:hypothetical protein n=1 Tax=Vibrio kanaloae TaxID=170673 RepID=UPI0019D15164
FKVLCGGFVLRCSLLSLALGVSRDYMEIKRGEKLQRWLFMWKYSVYRHGYSKEPTHLLM